MRRLLLLAAAAALGLPAAAEAGTTFLFTGRGWGHGIGMSQYGAYGYAQQGWGYERILGHYYPGTHLGSVPARAVRVLVREDVKNVVVGSGAPYVLVDAAGKRIERPAGGTRLRAGEEGGIALRVGGEDVELAAPVEVEPTDEPARFGGDAYRGILRVHVDGKRLDGVNELGLEEYLAGVVPGEMPASWSIAALKAQAVVARTFALATMRSLAYFDVHDDVRSQVYGGIAYERPRASEAIRSTARQVVLWEGRPAHTFFYSTSGGRTAAIEDVWDVAPLPYLRSVKDPHDRISPHHRWGPVGFKARRLARKLETAVGAVRELGVERNGSRRVEHLLVRGTKGSASVPGATVRSRLGLRSSWFRTHVLSLLAGERKGKRVTVEGVATRPGRYRLERRVGDGAWQRISLPKRTKAGAFTLRLKVTEDTRLRLRRAGGGTALLRLRPAT